VEVGQSCTEVRKLFFPETPYNFIMVETFYYHKHHERQAEIQKRAFQENPKLIADLRRSFKQQTFFRAFYDMFLEGYFVSSKNWNGEILEGRENYAKLSEMFDEIYPKTPKNESFFTLPFEWFRQIAENIFIDGFECTSSEFNNETTPYDQMEDTRENTCILLDFFEENIMWTVGIFDRKDYDYYLTKEKELQNKNLPESPAHEV
jgi:hypothetical protein